MAPQRYYTLISLESVNMLPFKLKGTLQGGLSEELEMGRYPGLARGPQCKS